MITLDSTYLISVRLPALFRSLPFQHGNFSATLSINICPSSLLNLSILRGRPRYLHGNWPCWTWNCPSITGMSIPSHLIGKISDFCTLVHSHVAIPNQWSRCCRFDTSEAIGLRNSIASSAYKLVLNLIGPVPIGLRRPYCVAMSNIFWKGSIAKIKSMGER
jgi:hypothetical protein